MFEHGRKNSGNRLSRRNVLVAVALAAGVTFWVRAEADTGPADDDAPAVVNESSPCQIIGKAAVKITLDGKITSFGAYRAVDQGHDCPREPILAAIASYEENHGLLLGNLTNSEYVGKQLTVPEIAGNTPSN